MTDNPPIPPLDYARAAPARRPVLLVISWLLLLVSLALLAFWWRRIGFPPVHPRYFASRVLSFFEISWGEFLDRSTTVFLAAHLGGLILALLSLRRRLLESLIPAALNALALAFILLLATRGRI